MTNLMITPDNALIDVSRILQVKGVPPYKEVQIKTMSTRGGGTQWHACAHFISNAHGEIDVSKDAPTSGGYHGVSAMGLIWSQAPSYTGDVWGKLLPDDWNAPVHTEVTVFLNDQVQVKKTMVQQQVREGVKRQVLHEHGFYGVLFSPNEGENHPAVIILNGSNGGVNEHRAALYASQGYAALALGYFNVPGRSKYISNTELTYFEKALHWVHLMLKPRRGFVALSGQSRGGELVLLLASLFPKLVSCVIAYVPGALIHSAQNACDPLLGRNGPAWLYQGKALPHLCEDNKTVNWDVWDNGPAPRRHANALLTALEDRDAVQRSRIWVEKMQCPVMLISGTDDGSWPSSLYCKMVKETLEKVKFPYPVLHCDYQDAGHSILFPYVPTTQIMYTHPISGRASTQGGNAQANAVANEDSWKNVQAFLAQACQE